MPLEGGLAPGTPSMPRIASMTQARRSFGWDCTSTETRCFMSIGAAQLAHAMDVATAAICKAKSCTRCGAVLFIVREEVMERIVARPRMRSGAKPRLAHAGLRKREKEVV